MTYKKHLSKDKVLAAILKKDTHSLLLQKNIPIKLMGSIISQQLSTKVAAIIYERFLALFPAKKPTIQKVLDTPEDTLRAIGISYAKINYIYAVASFCLEHKITDKKLQKLSNEEIIELLTQIKGVGKWTVEMLLMFSLGREDVFAVDDLGIQQAMTKLYDLDPANKKQFKLDMLAIAEAWSPFRTYACLHLWRWKDAV
ncbi:MAG: DNA-3-methyladenine glycosylase 2 family protein [Bacteroidetes bacterium]|jgi:DNA-3-methyladenine glycosylase II|nr:DNA-3-methyladenine glycosylase 2 family protein [Bacteroidota bacterium]